jgi:Ca2+-binding EF-hand superfamily protein
MDMGHANPGATKERKLAFLAVEFEKADADGSGQVDFDEFVHFYVTVVQHDEAENAARSAFAKYARSVRTHAQPVP